ncbi:MAG TPA: hypothetical protein VJN88_05060 [Ktedonobacterales bacterium]|nr:hypothetical protein [Ktedonobacterales bacterium]
MTKRMSRAAMSQSGTSAAADATEARVAWDRVIRRRSFLKAGVGAGVASAVLPASGLLMSTAHAASDKLPRGDVAILRFLAAAELIESDLWSQYAELGGANGGNPAYIAALQNLDGDMPQYISDNTDDELSHAAFLNAYLKSKGEAQVNLDEFRKLPSSKATGARQIGRLTNLLRLDVDTSWYTRYRGSGNPDFGTVFPQALTIKNQPAIPLNDTDTPPNTPVPQPPLPSGNAKVQRIQAIANTAGFHFAFIEQGGSSLYSTLALKVTNLEVLRIVISIGGVEVDHFSLWHDKVGNAVAQPLAGVTDPETGLHFPDFNDSTKFPSEEFQTNLILPEPAEFLRDGFPAVSIIRPTSTEKAGAVAAIQGFTDDLLFAGQSQEFFETAMELARAADAAQRGSIRG